MIVSAGAVELRLLPEEKATKAKKLLLMLVKVGNRKATYFFMPACSYGKDFLPPPKFLITTSSCLAWSAEHSNPER